MKPPIRGCVRLSEFFGQTDLFAAPTGLPEGFRYRLDFLSVAEDEALARELAKLPFKPFDFLGYLANRQVVSFGYRYDYDRRVGVVATPFPSFWSRCAARLVRFSTAGGLFPPSSH